MDVLVIGLGSMGKRRIRLLRRFHQIEHIIGVDAKEDRREEAENNYFCKTYCNIEDAIAENQKLECAFVCTPPLSHSKIITQMLESGLHVFSEINLVADGYKHNVFLARQINRVLFLSSTFFYRKEILYIQERIKEKSKLNYTYHIGQYLPDWHPWESYEDFFVGHMRTNGCREIMAIELPWIIKTFGAIKNYHVIADNISNLNISYKDNYFIQLEHEFGNKGALVIDIVSPKAVRNLEIYGENVYFSWDGTPSGLEYFEPETREIKTAQLYDTIDYLEGYKTFIIENAYWMEIQSFFDTIEGKSKPSYGFEEDLEVLSLIDQIEGVCNG